MPPHCSEAALTEHSVTRHCVLEAAHGGDHMDLRGETWEDPAVVLPRLAARWGHTHRVAWTGRLWLATHRAPGTHWCTEVEPTPALLEAALVLHHGPPSGPAHASTGGPG